MLYEVITSHFIIYQIKLILLSVSYCLIVIILNKDYDKNIVHYASKINKFHLSYIKKIKIEINENLDYQSYNFV